MRYFHLSIVLAIFLLCSFSPGESHSFEAGSQSDSLLTPDLVQTVQPAKDTLQKPEDRTTVVDNALKRLSETLKTADPSKAEDKNKIDDQLKELGLSDEDITKLTKELEKSKNPEILLKEFTDALGINPFSSASVEFAKSLQRALATPKTGALAPYQPLTEKPTNKEKTGPTIPLKVNPETNAVSVTDRKALTDLINSKDPETHKVLKDNGLGNLIEPNRTNAIQIGDHLVLPRDKAGNIQVLDPEQSKNWIQEQKQIHQDFLGMAKAGVSFPETTDAKTGEKSRSLKIENPQEFLEKLRADPELLKAMDRQVNGLGANLLTQSLHEEALNLYGKKIPTMDPPQYNPWIQHNTNQAFIEANKGNRPSTDQNQNRIIEETRPMLNALASMRQTEAALKNSGASLTPDQKLKLAEAKALISNQLGGTSEDGRYGEDYRKTFQNTLGKASDRSEYQALYQQVKNKGNDPEMPNLDLVTRLNTRDRVEKDLQEIISGKVAGNLDDLIKEAARVSGTGYIDFSKGFLKPTWSKDNNAVAHLEAVQKALLLSAVQLDRAQIAPDLANQLRKMSGDLSKLHAVQANQKAEEYAAKVKTEITSAVISLATLGAGQLLTLGARAIQVASGTAKAHSAFQLSKVSLFSLKDGAAYLGTNVLIGGSMGGSFYIAGANAKYIDDLVKGKSAKFEFSLQDLGVETLKGSAIGGAVGFSPAGGAVVATVFTVLGAKTAAEDLEKGNIAQAVTNIVGGLVAPLAINKISNKISKSPLSQPKSLEAHIKTSEPPVRSSHKQVPEEFAKKLTETTDHKFTKEQQKVLFEAHQVGKENTQSYKGNYTPEQLQTKYTMAVEGLIKSGITEPKSHQIVKELMKKGVLGKEPPAFNLGDSFTGRDADRLRIGDVVDLTSVRGKTRRLIFKGPRLDPPALQVMELPDGPLKYYPISDLQRGVVVEPSSGKLQQAAAGNVSSPPKSEGNFAPSEIFVINSYTVNRIPANSTVEFLSKRGNSYEGIYKKFDPSTGKILISKSSGVEEWLTIDRLDMVEIKRAPEGQAKPANHDRGPPNASPATAPGVHESPSAKLLREQALYNRNPNYLPSPEFHNKSKAAHSLFNDWLSKSGHKEPVGQLLDKMQEAYYGAEKSRGGLDNPRGQISRDFVKDRMGLNPVADGQVSLPGIAPENSPRFDKGTYFYGKLADGGRAQYDAALNKSLRDYAVSMIELDAIGAKGKSAKNSPEYLKKENEVFDAIVDFGRVAAAYRPYVKGNWGLFGPMIHTMSARMGYEIRNPGFMDIVLQAADPVSLKASFGARVRSGEPFYTADGYDPVKPRKSQAIGDPSTPLGRARIQQRILGNDPASQRFLEGNTLDRPFDGHP